MLLRQYTFFIPCRHTAPYFGFVPTCFLLLYEQILTKNEMIIFQLLLDRIGEIVTRDELMTALWDNDEFVNDNALSVNISRLRAKLGELGFPDAIVTRKKQGYVLI